MRKKEKPICPKCKSVIRNMFGDKKIMPRWKTKTKGKEYVCRHCGYVKEEKV